MLSKTTLSKTMLFGTGSRGFLLISLVLYILLAQLTIGFVIIGIRFDAWFVRELLISGVLAFDGAQVVIGRLVDNLTVGNVLRHGTAIQESSGNQAKTSSSQQNHASPANLYFFHW